MARTRTTILATTNDPPMVDATPLLPQQTSADNTTRTETPVPNSRSTAIDSRPPLHDRPAYEDVRSPYFLNNADHPGLVLATPVLTDRNFQPWQRDFKLSIGARNKTPFLDGSLPQPPPHYSLYSSWNRCNQNGYVVDHSLGFSRNQNKYHVPRHSSRDVDRTQQPIQSRAIWDEINQLRPRITYVCAVAAQNHDHINHDQVLQFLKGLHESYHAVRDQILLIDPCPPLNKVFSMLQIKHPRTNGLALTVLMAKKQGHYKDKCYFLHGFPPGYGKPRFDSNNHKKPDSGSTSRPQTHQVSTTDSQLTQAQCQQLISMLTQQLQPATDASTSDQPAVNNTTATILDAHLVEPKSYSQACKQKIWNTAMDTEIDALEANNTWIVVPLPPGQHVISNKWVYRIKYNPDGSVERLKAQLVAKGYTQQQGIDYF
uniref:Reverse transcriptase Ty1/copia-type domain-containing protein n=1 Tax=Cannabis sativa TaxID=3483 RepID=A0A803PTB3_CANSA